MGAWLGGTYHLQAMMDLRARGHRITTITPGADLEAGARVLRELAPRFEQTIVQGYPPLVREVLERAAGRGVDLCALDLRLVVSGEPISVAWRDYVVGLIGQTKEHVRSIYGSADTRAIAVETPATIALRRLATPGSRLWRELYGDEAVTAPMLVEYDPRLRHVETGDDGMLLFTLDGTLPLIRYQLGDLGAALSSTELRARAEQAVGRALPDLPAGPCLVVHSRRDIAAIFNGANIYPHDIHAALEQPALRSHLTGKFVLTVREAPGSLRPVLDLAVECKACPNGNSRSGSSVLSSHR